jgi:hypothetical protein
MYIFLKTTHRDEFNGISHVHPNCEKNDPGAEPDSGPAGPRSSESWIWAYSSRRILWYRSLGPIWSIKALGYKNANATSFCTLDFGPWPQLEREWHTIELVWMSNSFQKYIHLLILDIPPREYPLLVGYIKAYRCV